jgi:hypothetical protein
MSNLFGDDLISFVALSYLCKHLQEKTPMHMHLVGYGEVFLSQKKDCTPTKFSIFKLSNSGMTVRIPIKNIEGVVFGNTLTISKDKKYGIILVAKLNKNDTDSLRISNVFHPTFKRFTIWSDKLVYQKEGKGWQLIQIDDEIVPR